MRYVRHIARYGGNSDANELLKVARPETAEKLVRHLALFRAMLEGTQARGGQLNSAAKSWGEDVARNLIVSTDDTLAVAGIELCGTLKITALDNKLASLATDKTQSEDRRGAAMAALPALDAKKHIDLLGRILADDVEPAGLRDKAASILGSLNQPEAQDELVKALALAPQRLQVVIAMALAGGKTGATQLMQTLAAGKASPRVLQEPAVTLRLQGSGFPRWKEQVAKLTQGLPPADQQIQALLQSRHDGFVKAKHDPAAGAKVFEKSCAICHILANKGAKIGPQLDGIGNRGLDRLLEDIIDPNRNVDQAFRLTTLNLKNGQIVSGLALREEGEILVLADSQGKEIRIDKKDIEEKIVSQLSPMPANLVEQIPEADFYHLLAFLLLQRPEK